MILSIVVTLLAIIGIYGFFSGFDIFLIVGCISVVVQYIIGFFSGKLKGFSTFWLTLFIAIIISIIFRISFLKIIGVCICIKCVIFFIFGLILMFFISSSQKENA